MSSPQETYDAMAAAGVSKITAPWGKQALQAFMAGSYVALGALFANLMEAGFQGENFPPGLSNLVGGAVFPIGLIAIFLTGANLYTGNCMYVVPVLLNSGKAGHGADVPRLRALQFLALSWVCNFCGAIFVAYFIAYQGEWTAHGNVHTYVQHNAQKKCNLKWTVALLRGVGANWLVCLAWWQALSSKDTVSKVVAVWWPVFAFTAIGFEHSIANMFYVDIGLFEGAHATFGQFVWHNLIPVTIGNFLGGGVFLGAVQWATYDQGALTAAGSASYQSIPDVVSAGRHASDVETGRVRVQ